MTTSGRTGRRPGESGTREAILSAARTRFAAGGYAGTSLRAIAGEAGVDVALVRYFFGSKDDLFDAVLALPPQILERVREAYVGDPAGVGERVVRAYLGIWEDPQTGPAAMAVFRSAVAAPAAAELLREFLQVRLLQEVLPGPDEQVRLRAALAGSQLVGIVMARYVVGLEPVASLSVDRLVDLVAPVIQGYLTD